MPSRYILRFLIKVCSLTALFTTILIVLFGLSKQDFQSNSHLEKYPVETIKSEDGGQLPTGNRQPTAEFQQDLNNLIGNEHRDAYVDSLKTKNRCSLDQEVCDKITRASEYQSYQKKYFQTMTIGLINNLDTLITQGKTSRQCLSRLKLYKDEVAARGSATHTSIKMNTQPVESYREYRQVLTHELGHIRDLCGLDESDDEKDSNFTEFGEKVFGKKDPSLIFYRMSRESERVRKKLSSSKDFISGYASKNPFEDFAESHQAYLNHPRKFLELANTNTILMAKYRYFKKLYGDITFDVTEYPKQVTTTKTRVWDTTRWE